MDPPLGGSTVGLFSEGVEGDAIVVGTDILEGAAVALVVGSLDECVDVDVDVDVGTCIFGGFDGLLVDAVVSPLSSSLSIRVGDLLLLLLLPLLMIPLPLLMLLLLPLFCEGVGNCVDSIGTGVGTEISVVCGGGGVAGDGGGPCWSCGRFGCLDDVGVVVDIVSSGSFVVGVGFDGSSGRADGFGVGFLVVGGCSVAVAVGFGFAVGGIVVDVIGVEGCGLCGR